MPQQPGDPGERLTVLDDDPLSGYEPTFLAHPVPRRFLDRAHAAPTTADGAADAPVEDLTDTTDEWSLDLDALDSFMAEDEVPPPELDDEDDGVPIIDIEPSLVDRARAGLSRFRRGLTPPATLALPGHQGLGALALAAAAVSGGGLWWTGALGASVPASALGAGVAPATIVVSSTPSGSGVFVNGELHGTTPLAVVLPGGAHQVEVRTVDGRTEHFSLEADSGARVTRHVDFGTVAVLATPPAEPTAVPRERPRPATAPVAQVVVDVRAAPAATPTPLPRPAPARRPVTGSLNVNALPWAEILIDGRAFGETPLANIVLPVGTHEILFRHPQLGEQTRTVVIGPEGPTRVSVDLRR